MYREVTILPFFINYLFLLTFIPLLANLLHSNEKELYTIWIADQIYEIIKEESNPSEILHVVEKEIKLKLKHYE